MTLTESIKVCYDKYATFDGRASKSEFWWAHLFFLALFLLLRYGTRLFLVSTSACMLAYFWGVICFLPLVSVAVRRLHDIGRNGWWLLGLFVGLATALVVIVDVAMLWGDMPLAEATERTAIPCIAVTVSTAVYYAYTMSRPTSPLDEDDF